MNEPARKIIANRVAATLEELLSIPEEKRRHEIIEGALYQKEAASGEHGAAQWALSGWLAPFGRRPGGRYPGGWWFVTEVEIFFDARNTFRPDLAGWRREHLPERPTGIPIRVRPDWVCEILSTNRNYDLIKKKRIYHRHEVPHYWIVDPVAESLTVYRWGRDGYVEVLVAERNELVYPEPFESEPFPLGTLFGDDPEDSKERQDDDSNEPSPSD